MVEMSYGPLGLELMSAGKTAKESLDSLLKSDEKAETRQVAMVDSKGNVSVHTGSRCTPFAGHSIGEQFSCQANLMRNDTIWGQMEKAFLEHSDLELPERLLFTLEAAEAAGGDIRGKQSAAILVVSPGVFANPWTGRIMELRVEDSLEPLPELRRLIKMRRGYDWAERGDELLSSGNLEEASMAFSNASKLAPDNEEIRYWVGVSFSGSSSTDKQAEGRAMLKELFAKNKDWIQVTRGLFETGYLAKKDSAISDLIL